MSILSDALDVLGKAGYDTASSKALSPSELAVIQAKYPGRIINPVTGMPASVRGASGKFGPAMMEGAGEEVPVDGTTAVVPKPDVSYEDLLSGAKDIVSNAARKTSKAFQPDVPRNPETGQAIPVRDPVTGRMMAATPVYSPTQKAVAGTLGAGALGSAAYTSGNKNPAPAAMTPEQISAAQNAFDIDDQQARMSRPVDYGPSYLTNEDLARIAASPVDKIVPARSAPAATVSNAKQVMSRNNQPLIDLNTKVPGEQASIPSAASLWDKYNQTGDPADFIRADTAMKAERAASGASNEKRGGSVDGKGKEKSGEIHPKDAVLHKALEIIHHMIVKHHG